MDLFVDISLHGFDFSDEESFKYIYDTMVYLIEPTLVDKNDLKFFNFKIEVNHDIFIRIVPENIITAMWFCGILPNDVKKTMSDNYLKHGNKTYRFDKKRGLLTIKEKEKNE